LNKGLEYFITFVAMKRLVIRILLVFSAIMLALLLVYFLFRNQILKEKVAERVSFFNKSHSINILYKNVSFKGLADVGFDSLIVKGKSADTLVSVASLSAGIKIIPLIKGTISMRKLNIEHIAIIADLSEIKYYFKEFSTTKKIHKNDQSEINLYTGTDRLLKRVFAAIPSDLIVKNAKIIVVHDSVKAGYTISNLAFKHGKLASEIEFSSDSLAQTVIISGKIKPGQRLVELNIVPQDENTLLHSPVASLFGALIHYKSLSLSFIEKGNKENIMKVEGSCSINDFQVRHKYLSSEIIDLPICSMTFDFSVGKNYLELDSMSIVNLGELRVHPYFKYSISPIDSVTVGCYVPAFTVEEFYKSIPADLFPEIKNIKAEGSLSYRAKMAVDLKQPDSLLLESNLIAKDFKIEQLDNELFKMNADFVYTAYEKGNPMRTIIVGPENPNFRTLEEIPMLLQRSILLAEDDAFFYHKGFLIESVRYAIAQNIKQHRLFRGGSTISQQLIKNVYLSRDKTLSRKVEEIILVWLIESNRLVSKSHMFEVYLNIIEWGPNVYGVNEAARFYFKKDIRQLNATECIFLASVIPSPKKFYYRFDKEGNLAPFMLQYYRDMAEKMQWRGLLPTTNGDSLSSLLKITGPAKEFLQYNKTLADSVQYSDLDDENMIE
jgi:hypothetical protein